MKRAKTLLSIFFCIMACALFGACSCSAPNVSVVAIKITEVSDNVVSLEGSSKYLVRKGDTFSITYEIQPSNASDFTTYIEMTPANKLSTANNVVKPSHAVNTIEFKASNINLGESIIQFQTKDGSATVSISVEIVGDDNVLSAPENVKYDNSTNSFVWDKSTVETKNGIVEANKYAIKINDDEFFTTTNSYKYNMESGEEHYVRVRAVGDLAQRTSDSNMSRDVRFFVADSPTRLSSNNGVLSWEYGDDTEINNFILEIFDNDVSYKVYIADTTTRSFDLANYIEQENIEIGEFSVRLSAVNSDYVNGSPNSGNIMTYIISSRNNPRLSLTRFGAPTGLAITNTRLAGDIYKSSMLQWDAVPNATAYNITVYKDGVKKGEVVNKSNYINLTKSEFVLDSVLAQESGEFRLEIVAQGEPENSFSKPNAFANFEFVVTPFLYGNVNYSTDNLELLVADYLSILGLSADRLSTDVGYEVYYSANISGSYDNVTTISNPSDKINLKNIISLNQYNILIRPITTASYTTKNVVLPIIKDINFNKSTDMVTRLKDIEISAVDNNGYVTVTDNNTSGDVKQYSFVLSGISSSTQVVYSNNTNLTFSGNEFTIDIVSLFNISQAGNYSLTINPMSNQLIDSTSNEFAFRQLASVDPSTIVINNNVISWNGVSGYSSYLIKINDEEAQTVNSNSFAIDDPTILRENNTITIKVVGNNINAISSGTVSVNKSRASVVSGFKVIDGELTWTDDVANSTYYITITNSLGSVEKLTLSTNKFTGLGKISDSATITVSRGVNTAFNSEESAEIVLERLSTPTNDLSIVNHLSTAEFTAVDNAVNYIVAIKKDSVVTKTINLTESDYTSTDGKIRFDLGTLDDGEYMAYIQAEPSDQTNSNYESKGKFYLISDISDGSDFVVYPSVEVLNRTHNLVWSLGSTYNVKDYTIHFDNDEYSDIVLANANYSFEEISAGTYNITISASSTADNVIYSTPTATTIVKVNTPSISYSSGRIEFEVTSSASSYKVYNGDDELLGTGVDYNLSVEGNKAYITPLNLQESQQYSMYIVAIGIDDVIDGDKSNTVTFGVINGISAVEMTTRDGSKVFVWGNVEGNNGYEVTLSSAEGVMEKSSVSTNSFTLPAKYFSGEHLLDAGDYTLSVVVLSNTLINSNPRSQTFAKLDVVTNMQFDNNAITWNYAGSGTPTSFSLTVLTYDESESMWSTVNTYSVSNVSGVTPTFNVSQIEYDNYRIMIKCVGSDSSFALDGENELFAFSYGTAGESEKNTFSRIATPTLSYADGKLQLIGTDEASDYEVYLIDNDNNYVLLQHEYSLDSDNYLNFVNTATTYEIVAKAIARSGNGKLDSYYSTSVVVSKLNAVSDFTVTGSGMLKWTPISDAKGYIIYNITADKQTPIDGGATDSISYMELYNLQGLEIGSTNEFVIMAVGEAKDEINYLNSEKSSSVIINAVDRLGAININDGVLSWAEVDGVQSYKVEVIKNSTTIYETVINDNKYNINNLAKIGNGETVQIKISPFATEDNSYIIVDGDNSNTIQVKRNNCISKISVENGLLKFKINVSGISLADLSQIANADDYSKLSDDIKDGYYGYYNFNININDKVDYTISLNDMSYTVNATDFLSGVFYATYELPYNVTSTTLLNLKITSCGNLGGSSEVTYNSISNIVNNNSKISVYKHPAPVPTASSNLVASDGKLTFKLINGESKYILTAVGQYTDGSQETLTYIIDTTGTTSQSYTTENLSAIRFTKVGENTQKVVDGDIEYSYSLTTLGTESGDSGELYLRSNKYTTATVTFVSNPTGLGFSYNSGDTNGGYITWGKNNKAVSYKLYALNINDASTDYPDTTSVYNSSAWIDNEKAYAIDFAPEKTSYFFEDGGFYIGSNSTYRDNLDLPAGTYWLALKSIGDNENYITPAGASSSITVKKLNAVNNACVSNGVFTWKILDAEMGQVTGFRIQISTYSDGLPVVTSVVTRPTLMSTSSGVSTYSYDLETLISEGDTTYSFLGDNEAYGISVVAVGGSKNTDYYVNSAYTYINNNNYGYQRLDTVTLSANADLGQLEWDAVSQAVSNVYRYELYINGSDPIEFETLDSARKLAFSDTRFASAGDYVLKMRVTANGGEYLNGILSNEFTVIKYHKPILNVKDGVLEWSNSENGEAHQPFSSTLTVINKGSGKIINVNGLSAFTYELSNSTDYPTGAYTVSVKYDGKNIDSTYHIASEEVSAEVYKLGTPQIQLVNNLSLNGERECDEFAVCFKWNLVKDASGNYRDVYNLLFYVAQGEEEFRLNEEYTTTIQLLKSGGEFVNGDDYVIKDGVVYYDIHKLGELLKGYRVRIYVQAVGDDSVNLNSSQTNIELDYDVQAPILDVDATHGIIRWSGSNNPVLIEISYWETSSSSNKQNVQVYLDADYIGKYGKVYYLPYMTQYESIEVQFVIGDAYSGGYTSGSESANVSAQTLFSSGDGLTAETSYIITNKTQLYNIQYRPNSYIKINSGLTIDVGEWSMIERFGGVLDGNGSTLTNIKTKIVSGAKPEYAMFKEIMEGAVIKNVTLGFTYGIGSSTVQQNQEILSAGIVLTNNGTVSDVVITGSFGLYGTKSIYSGGAVYKNYGIIDNVCYSAATQLNNGSVGMYAGGIVCYNYGVVNNCTNSGSISGISTSASARRIGGIVFRNYGVIFNSEFEGSLCGFDMAGIVVVNTYSADSTLTYLDNDYESGSVLGCYSIGSYSFPDGLTSSNMYVGGIVGENNDGIVGRCYAIMTSNLIFTNKHQNSSVYVGGIVARNSHDTSNAVKCRIENCYTNITATFTDNSGSISRSAVCNGSAEITNVLYYSSQAEGTVISGATKVSSSTELATDSNKDALNVVAEGDNKYDVIREFAVVDSTLTLQHTT